MRFLDFMKLKKGDNIVMNGIKPYGYQWPGVAKIVKRYPTYADVVWGIGEYQSATVMYTDIKKASWWMTPFLYL